MKREEAEALKARIENEGILCLINDMMSSTFGLLADCGVSIKESRHDCWMHIEAKSDDATKQLTKTPLLRRMFKEATVECDAYYYPKEGGMTASGEDELYGRVHIRYSHPGGGFNGLEIGRLIVRLDSKLVEIK